MAEQFPPLSAATLAAANQVGAWLAQDDLATLPALPQVDVVVLAGNAVIPTIDAACRMIREMLPGVNAARRTKQPLSGLTGQVAGGCNVVCFTTGRGSVSGWKPAPTIKIATKTEMYDHMREDMDIDTGTESIESAGEKLFERILAVASGEKTLSEQFDYGDNEFVPWQVGAIL